MKKIFQFKVFLALFSFLLLANNFAMAQVASDAAKLASETEKVLPISPLVSFSPESFNIQTFSNDDGAVGVVISVHYPPYTLNLPRYSVGNYYGVLSDDQLRIEGTHAEQIYDGRVYARTSWWAATRDFAPVPTDPSCVNFNGVWDVISIHSGGTQTDGYWTITQNQRELSGNSYWIGLGDYALTGSFAGQGICPIKVNSITAIPNTLWIDNAGFNSGMIFRATTSEATTVAFSILSPSGESIPLESVATQEIGGIHTAATKWFDKNVAADLISGSYRIVARAGSDSKETTFEVEKIDADALGHGTWLTNKNPATGKGPEPSPNTCPPHKWEQLIDHAAADFHNLTVSDPVNAIFGNFLFSEIDLQIKGNNPLVLARIYNSLDPEIGPFGRGWSSPYTSHLSISSNRVWFINSDGGRLLFTSEDGLNYNSPARTSLKLVYNQDTEFWTISHPHGDQWSFDNEGKLISMAKACCGRGVADSTLCEYDQNKNLLRVTTATGQSLTFTSDTAGKIVAVTDHTGRTLGYSYDENNNLVSFSNPIGQVTAYQYSEENFLTKISKAGGLETTADYIDNRIVEMIQPGGETIKFGWDMESQKMTLTAANGVAHVYSFTADWLFNGYSVPDIGLNEVYQVSDAGLVGHTNSLNSQESSSFNSLGLEESRTDFLGNTTQYEYHPTLQKLTKKTDSLGRSWSYEWCQRGNLIKQTDPAGNITSYTYDSHNNRTSKTDALGHVTQFVYDSTGNYLLQTIDAAGGVSSFTYDLRGNLTSSTDQLTRTTSYEYDLIDRLVKSTYADGRLMFT